MQLLNKIILTPEIHAYTCAPETSFTFKPGQFVMLRQPGAEPKFNRAFSMASAPSVQEVTFLMKYNPEGHVSGYLAASKPGAKLEASEPTGRFILNPDDTERIFVATGTGLAPIVSFIDHLIHEPDGIPFTTMFGVRSEENLFWTEKLPENSIVTLSQPSPTWTGTTGRVTAHVHALHAEHPAASWYLCGSPDMIKDTRSQLLDLGVPASALHFEVY